MRKSAPPRRLVSLGFIVLLIAISLNACSKKRTIDLDNLSDEDIEAMIDIVDKEHEKENSSNQSGAPATSLPQATEAQTQPVGQPPEQTQEMSDFEKTYPEKALMLSVSELYDGLFMFEDNGDLYTLGGSVWKSDDVMYDIGLLLPNQKQLLLYDSIEVDGDVVGVMTYGDIPVFRCANGCGIRAYAQNYLPTLDLNKVEFYGYTVGVNADKHGNVSFCNPEVQQTFVYHDNTVSNVEIRDPQGNLVEDIRNLRPDEMYHTTWAKGTQMFEHYSRSLSKVYRYTSRFIPGMPEYSIEGEPTPSGLAAYDLSSLPSGLYALYPAGSGIIEIP